MTAPRALRFRWDGTAMFPLQPGAAARQFEKGEVYPLEVRRERNWASHRHYFAVIEEGFRNLPEHLADHFRSADHLRHYLLVKAGFYTSIHIVTASRAEATRKIAGLQSAIQNAVIEARGPVLNIFIPKSQSAESMGREEFQASKEATLNLLAELIGTDKETLAKNAGQAA